MDSMLLFVAVSFAIEAIIEHRHGTLASSLRATRSHLPRVALAGLGFAFWIGTSFWSMGHTSVVHSVLFYTLLAPPMLVIKLAKRERISPAELYGVGLALCGALLTQLKVAGGDGDVAPPGRVTFFGDAVAFAGAWGGALYLSESQAYSAAVPTTFSTLLVTLITCVGLHVGVTLQDGGGGLLSADPRTGQVHASVACVCTLWCFPTWV